MSNETYKKLNIGETSKEIYAIPLSGQCAGLTQLTIVGSPITIPHKVIGADIYFPDTTIHNVRVYLLKSSNSATSTTSVPEGSNIFSRYAPTSYFIGHDELVKITCRIYDESIINRVKLHINNLNTWASYIQAVVYVEAV